MELTLNLSDEMYRRVIMAVPEGIWIVDLQGRTIFSNVRMAEILGNSMEQMPEQSCFACLFPEEVEAAQQCFANGLAGDRRPFDFRLRRRDGSPIWVSITCMPMADEAGVHFGLLGMFTEITERKMAEAALRQSEEHLRAIINLAAVGVAQLSLKADLEMVNDRFCAIFGYPREELLRINLRELTHPDDLAEAIAQSRRLLSGEIPYFCMEKRHIRKDGSIIWSRVHKSCVKDPAGVPRHYIVVLEDITEAARAQAALRESEERFRTMADSAPVMITVCDPALHVTFCNRRVMTFTGRNEEQLQPPVLKELVHAEDLDRVVSSVLAAVESRRVFEIEFRMQRADGEFRFVFTTGTPRFVAGAYAGYIMITLDITELKRKQEYVLSMQKLESLGVLAGGIAHDFNNLLGGILASAELISDCCEDGLPPDQESILRIKTAAIRGGEIVRQLMVYGGEENRTFASVDVPQLVSEMLQLLKVSISKRATLHLNFPSRLPAVRANAAQLRQVVLNLITNASEALEEKDGFISVTATLVPDAHLQTPALAAGDYVQLEVSDSGCGMTREVQARIFDPFFTSKFAGRGLGLASVQGMVRGHGGAITVASAPGKGSRFEILLPCSGDSAREAPPAHTTARPKDASLSVSVLLVEDEDPLRLAVSKMLQIRGFEVMDAADGKSAVNLFRLREEQIDVVLLDLNLPGMSGREVFHELKRIRPDVKVILTSAYSREWVEASVGASPTSPYIRKPYQLNDLTELLRSVCTG